MVVVHTVYNLEYHNNIIIINFTTHFYSDQRIVPKLPFAGGLVVTLPSSWKCVQSHMLDMKRGRSCF